MSASPSTCLRNKKHVGDVRQCRIVTPKNPPPLGVGSLQKYGKEQRSVEAKGITVRYKTDHGMAEKNFTVYRTHHGPIIREADGKWVSIRLMQEPVKALMQSYGRTKAKSYAGFRETMELHTNSSNNTIFADADGDIAYFHGNFIPRRNTSFDWTKPVDGSNPATEWHGLLSVDETPHLLNPRSGWHTTELSKCCRPWLRDSGQI